LARYGDGASFLVRRHVTATRRRIMSAELIKGYPAICRLPETPSGTIAIYRPSSDVDPDGCNSPDRSPPVSRNPPTQNAGDYIFTTLDAPKPTLASFSRSGQITRRITAKTRDFWRNVLGCRNPPLRPLRNPVRYLAEWVAVSRFTPVGRRLPSWSAADTCRE